MVNTFCITNILSEVVKPDHDLFKKLISHPNFKENSLLSDIMMQYKFKKYPDGYDAFVQKYCQNPEFFVTMENSLNNINNTLTQE